MLHIGLCALAPSAHLTSAVCTPYPSAKWADQSCAWSCAWSCEWIVTVRKTPQKAPKTCVGTRSGTKDHKDNEQKGIKRAQSTKHGQKTGTRWRTA